MSKVEKTFSFASWASDHPSDPVPGDRIDIQFANHRKAIESLDDAVHRLVRADGKLNHDLLTEESMPRDLLRGLASQTKREVQEFVDPLVAQTKNHLRDLEQAQLDLQATLAEVKARQREATKLLDSTAALSEVVHTHARQAMQSVTRATNLQAQAYEDANWNELQANTAEDWALVSTTWAEFMDGNATIPPNILASNSITGDHWSSRWWANRAASAFGMLAWWYQGAWPSPGPPTTPNTPTGQPLPPGSIYFDTDLGVMMVWNGSTWVNANAPAKGATSSLYYLASAGQTVFPLGTVDLNGHTFAFNQTTPEGLQAYVNGVRLTPTLDFTLDTVGSSVTFLHGLSLNSVVAFDMLTPASMLAPSGSALTVLLSPITPDGVKTVFTGLTVAADSAPVNVAKNEELLVSVNGVQQQPGAAYNASADTIAFAQAPEADANIFVIWFGPSDDTSQPPTPAFVYPGAPAGLFSMRKVGAGYNGPCLNAIRTTDGAQQDIGFASNGMLDGAAAAAFAGAGQLFVATWYDQSGNGRNAAQPANASRPRLVFTSGVPYLSFPHSGSTFVYLQTAAATGLTLAGDFTVGVVCQLNSDLGQIPVHCFDGTNGWFLSLNGTGSPASVGSVPGAFTLFTPTGGALNSSGSPKLGASSPRRCVAKRTSGSATLYVDGAAAGTGARTNSASTAPLQIGGYPGGNDFVVEGLIGEVFVYGSALADADRLAIDASAATAFPLTGFSTPYSGTSCLQFGWGQSVNFGNVLNYPKTQPWTIWAAVQCYSLPPNGASDVIVANVTGTTTYQGYALELLDDGHPRVRVISDFSATAYVDVVGTTFIPDGKKHTITATYDGSGLAAGVSIYVDGVLETVTRPMDTLGATINGGGQLLLVGNQQGIPELNFRGTISFFQIDKIARSAGVIGAFHGGALPAKDANTDLCLLLNEGSGAAVGDSSGNARNGTLPSATMWVP